MEFIIVFIVACVVFAFCFAVFLFKDRKEGGPPRLHRCGEGDDCHCYGKPQAGHPSDLVQILGGPPNGCDRTNDSAKRCCPTHRE